MVDLLKLDEQSQLRGRYKDESHLNPTALSKEPTDGYDSMTGFAKAFRSAVQGRKSLSLLTRLPIPYLLAAAAVLILGPIGLAHTVTRPIVLDIAILPTVTPPPSLDPGALVSLYIQRAPLADVPVAPDSSVSNKFVSNAQGTTPTPTVDNIQSLVNQAIAQTKAVVGATQTFASVLTAVRLTLDARVTPIYTNTLTSTDEPIVTATATQTKTPSLTPTLTLTPTGTPPLTLTSTVALTPTATPTQSRSINFTFDHAFVGTGWQDPETTATWTKATSSTLDFRLVQGGSYVFSFDVVGAIKPDVLSSLSLFVNDKPIILDQQQNSDGSVIFSGIITSAVVSLDLTKTHFDFRVNKVYSPKALGIGIDERTLGIKFAWLHIAPPNYQMSIDFKFDHPFAGIGWAIAENTHTWMQATTAGLNVFLVNGRGYRIMFPSNALTPAILDSLKLIVNGVPINLTRNALPGSGYTFSGQISATVMRLNPDFTRLEFQVTNVISLQSLGKGTDTRQLGAVFTWLRIQ